jgi:hypothetical protein
MKKLHFDDNPDILRLLIFMENVKHVGPNKIDTISTRISKFGFRL